MSSYLNRDSRPPASPNLYRQESSPRRRESPHKRERSRETYPERNVRPSLCRKSEELPTRRASPESYFSLPTTRFSSNVDVRNHQEVPVWRSADHAPNVDGAWAHANARRFADDHRRFHTRAPEVNYRDSQRWETPNADRTGTENGFRRPAIDNRPDHRRHAMQSEDVVGDKRSTSERKSGGHDGQPSRRCDDAQPTSSKFLIYGRPIGAGKGGPGRNQNVDEDRIFNNVIKKMEHLKTTKGVNDVCLLIRDGQNLQNMNPMHTSTALDTLGKQLEKMTEGQSTETLRLDRKHVEESIHMLVERIVGLLQTDAFFNNQRSFVTVMHGFALLHTAGWYRVTESHRVGILQHLAQVLSKLRPWDLSQVLWSFGRTGMLTRNDAQLLSGIDAKCCELLDSDGQKVYYGNAPTGGKKNFEKFEGVDIANALQGLVQIENACGLKASEGLLERFEKYAGIEAHTQTTQGLVTTVSVFAKMGRCIDRSVEERLCESAMQIMGKGTTRDISNLLWGMAKLGWNPPSSLLDLLYSRMRQEIHRFKHQEIVNTLWATAMLNVRLRPGQEYWDCMMDRIHALVRGFNAQDMSMFFHALALMGQIPGQEIMRAALQRLEHALHDASPQNVVVIVRSLAVMQAEIDVTPEAIKVLSRKSVALINRFNGQDLSGMYWSFATLQICPDVELMRCMTDRLVASVDNFNPQDVSLVAWAINTGKWHRDDKDEDEEDLLTDEGRAVKSRTIARKNEVYDPTRSLRALARRSEALIHEFHPRDCANVFWAVTSLEFENWVRGYGEQHHEFFLVLCEAVEAQTKRNAVLFEARDVAQALKAISRNQMCFKGNVRDQARLSGLIHRLAELCHEHMPNFNVVDVCCVISATVHLDLSGNAQRDLLNVLVQRSLELMPQFEGQNLAELVWALGRTGHEVSSEFTDLACQRILDLFCAPVRIDAVRPQIVAVLLWGLAKMRTRLPEQLRVRLHASAIENVEHYRMSHLASILWATAACPAPPASPDSFERQTEMQLRIKVLRRVNACSEAKMEGVMENAPSILWALVVMSSEADLFYDDKFLIEFRRTVDLLANALETFFAQVAGNRAEDSAISAMCMLHQFFLSCAIDAKFAAAVGSEDCKMHRVRQLNAEQCRTAFTTRQTNTSVLQKQIRQVLEEHVKLDVKPECQCEKSGYTIDMQVSSRALGRVWSVEINGPSHFFRGNDRKKLGATRLKEHQLALLGHTVVNLPYWDWDRVEHDVLSAKPLQYDRLEDQVAYLQKAFDLPAQGEVNQKA